MSNKQSKLKREGIRKGEQTGNQEVDSKVSRSREVAGLKWL